MKQRKDVRVGVIGAGVSGLRAASLLVQEGFDVAVVEARDRIGGRLHQDYVAGHLVDFGANWIHGTQDNPIIKLAHEAGSVTVACGTVSSICGGNGTWMSCADAGKSYDEVWQILEEAFEYSALQSQKISSAASLEEWFDKRLTSWTLDEDRRQILKDIVEMWGAFIGTDWERQSLKHLWLEQGLEGDNSFLASTYERILKNLAQPMTNSGRLQLSTEVIRVVNQKEVTSDARISIEIADGRKLHFDEIVCTVPLGCLKHHPALFEPRLTDRLVDAIAALGVTNLDKVFITFPEPFWSTSPACSHGAHSIKVENLFLRPVYANSTNPWQWRQEMVSLASLPGEYAHPTVMFYVYGEWGRHVTDEIRNMPHESQERYDILNGLFKPYYSRLPGFDPNSSFCKPKSFLATDWQGDRLAGYGSFTNYPVGMTQGIEHIEAFRSGAGGDRGIWFAGDFTAPVQGLNTVVGAYWSGERVAKQICEKYRDQLAGASDEKSSKDGIGSVWSEVI